MPFDDHRKQNDTIHNRMVRVRRSGISSSNTENDRNPRRERSRGSGMENPDLRELATLLRARC